MITTRLEAGEQRDPESHEVACKKYFGIHLETLIWTALLSNPLKDMC